MVLTTQSTLQSIQSFFKLFHQSIILANTQWGQISWSGLSSGVNIFSWFSPICRFIIFAFYVHLPSVWRENYENNECKTSHSNTNTPLFVMIKTVFSYSPLAWVRWNVSQELWLGRPVLRHFHKKRIIYPEQRHLGQRRSRPKWEKPQTLNILSTTNFKF